VPGTCRIRDYEGSRLGKEKPGGLAPPVQHPGGGRTWLKANLHTVPHEKGWANRREGAKRISKVFRTKAEAQAAGAGPRSAIEWST
jgi:hypothetical protein